MEIDGTKVPSEIEALTLEDILPGESEFKLKSTGKTYRLRAFNLSDQAWIQKKFGAMYVPMFKRADPDLIAMVAIRLMLEEDRRDFDPKPCKFYNEETGETTEGRVGGAELLKHMATGGPSELEGMVRAIATSIGMSEIVLNKAAASIEADLKKKMTALSAGQPSSSSASTSGDSSPRQSAG